MKPPQHIVGERFLRGPIPLAWLTNAGTIDGKALHVGLYCWYLAGLTGSLQFKLPTGKLRALGVSRQAAYRGLAALAAKKLATVESKPGSCPIVTIRP